MKNQLTEQQTTILRSLCFKNNGDNRHLFDCLNDEKLNLIEIEKLCSIINDEFMMEGILPSYEPNDYGLELERLLDIVNKRRVQL